LKLSLCSFLEEAASVPFHLSKNQNKIGKKFIVKQKAQFVISETSSHIVKSSHFAATVQFRKHKKKALFFFFSGQGYTALGFELRASRLPLLPLEPLCQP
jgi:hypothetical protein